MRYSSLLIIAASVVLAFVLACSTGGGGNVGGDDVATGDSVENPGDVAGSEVPEGDVSIPEDNQAPDTEPVPDTVEDDAVEPPADVVEEDVAEEDLGTPDPCDPNPCEDANKTICTVENDEAVCSCDEGYEDDGEGNCVEIPPDPCIEEEVITLVINDPAADFISSAEPTLTVSGFASECVTTIAWANSLGGGEEVDASESWSISGIPLLEGDNVITFTGTGDYDQEPVEEYLVVAYSEGGGEILSPIFVDPDEILTGENVTITVRIGLEEVEGFGGESVRVIEVDEEFNEIAEVVSLYDDGNVANGDDIFADGVFSGKFDLFEEEEKVITYRIAWDIQPEGEELSTAFSEVFTVEAIEPITIEAAEAALEFHQVVVDKYEELQAENTEEEARQMTFEFVEAHELVEEATMEELGIWWLLKTGLEGSFYFDDEEGKESPGARKQTFRFGEPTKAQKTKVQEFLEKVKVMGKSPFRNPTKTMNAEDDVPVGSKKAVIYAPYYTENKNLNTAFEDDVEKMLNDSECPEYYVSAYYKDADASVANFKKMGGNGIIVVHTHGGYFKTGFLNLFRTVVLSTGEEATAALIVAYSIDIKKKRVSVLSTRDGKRFIIYPRFIKKYAKSLPSSLVYMGACHSLQNQTMSAAFIGNGAKTYYGFDDAVFKVYNNAIAKTLFKSLIEEHDNAKDAFDDAVAAHGAADADGAKFVMTGEKKLSLYVEELLNPGFEEGTTVGWQTLGDIRILAKLGPLSPTEGTYMSILSTGLGSVGESESKLSQTICVPEGATGITFSYNVVSEEPMEWVGSPYDDQFEATITVGEAAANQVAYESVNSSAWSEVFGIDFDGGDETVFQTGWKTVTAPVTPGDVLTLEFHVWDVGDSIYDTAALVDDVYLEFPD